MEKWIKIDGFTNYSVSNKGRIRNDITGRIMKLRLHKNGYVQIGLRQNGKLKMLSVHRLVATAFIPNPLQLQEVNHKNEIKTDNHSENLEWCTRKYNCNYGTKNERMLKTRNNSRKCIVDGNIFQSLRDAERYYNMPPKALLYAFRHNRTTYKNHTISYAS